MPEFIAGTPNIFDVPNDQIVVEPASFVARDETSRYFPMKSGFPISSTVE